MKINHLNTIYLHYLPLTLQVENHGEGSPGECPAARQWAQNTGDVSLNGYYIGQAYPLA